MDVNNSMRKSSSQSSFIAIVCPQDLAFQNVIHSPEQRKVLPQRNAMTGLSLFIQGNAIGIDCVNISSDLAFL